MKLRIGYFIRNLTMRLHTYLFPRAAAAVLGAALLYGCAKASQATTQSPSAGNGSPLSGLMSRQLALLPAQYIGLPTVGDNWELSPANAGLLPILDEEIIDQFRKRGVRNNWVSASDLTESAMRSGGLVVDPRQLNAQQIRRIKAGDTPLGEPLGTEIRNLVALTNARYALLPIEVHLDNRGGVRKGTVRFLLIDTRTARVVWADDVESLVQRDPQVSQDALSPYEFRKFAREVASHFADIVAGQ